MSATVTYSDEMAAYDLGPEHPLRPERFTLAIELMHELGTLDTEPPCAPGVACVARPVAVTREDLESVHDPAYVDAVMRASAEPHAFTPSHGIGPGDTPAFHGMHRTASLICGATALALRQVFESDTRRSFSIAGGLHHAHADRAAGFCVYNDPAVAIAMLKRDHPGVRVAYVDIDAHHGDGVQEAFYADPDVLTISVHESGRYLFPGTGRFTETGQGAGEGAAVNVPLPPLADDLCYRLVLHDVIRPALVRFAPDVMVAQCGADAHHADPLTHLGLTLPGYDALVRGIVECADEVCDGRICCTGGGGYGTYSVVPRAFAAVTAILLGRPTDPTLLADEYDPLPAVSAEVRAEVTVLLDRVRAASPLLAGSS